MGVLDRQLPRGRPRAKALDSQIMDAAWDLLGEIPMADLTIYEIAKKAGTTRPAVYRRWDSVEDIVIDAFLRAVREKVPTPSPASPPERLREYICKLSDFINSRVGRAIGEILGRSQSDPKLMTKFQDLYLLPRRDHARSIIVEGQDLGYFRSDLDTDFMIDLYAGPIYFRAFSRHAPMNEEFAQSLADQVLETIRTRDPQRSGATKNNT